jgi:hypothetical protein
MTSIAGNGGRSTMSYEEASGAFEACTRAINPSKSAPALATASSTKRTDSGESSFSPPLDMPMSPGLVAMCQTAA